MRQWNIDPQWMCRKHLLGEHTEMHMAVGTLRRGLSIAGFLRDGLLDPATIVTRHNDIAAEMLRRGMNHVSPLDISDAELAGYREGVSTINPDHNRRELARRCPDCRKLLASKYGSEIFADLPVGGDKIFRDENGLWRVIFNGQPIDATWRRRDAASIALDRLRKEYWRK